MLPQDYVLSKRLTKIFGEEEAINIMMDIVRERMTQEENARYERKKLKEEKIEEVLARLSVSADTKETVQKIDELKKHIDNITNGGKTNALHIP